MVETTGTGPAKACRTIVFEIRRTDLKPASKGDNFPREGADKAAYMATYAATRFAKAVFYLALFAPAECRRTVEACPVYVLVYRLYKQARVRKEASLENASREAS